MGPRSIADDIREELPDLDVDLDTKKAMEGWLATDREFNSWFLVTTKRALADGDLMELLDGYRESQETMTSAWSSFRKDRNVEHLQASVATSIARMDTLRSRV